MTRRNALGIALGSLAAVATTSLLAAPPAGAGPTWVHAGTISGVGPIPAGARVAMADDGSAVAAWVRSDGSDPRVMAASSVGGTWGAASFVSPPGRPASSPDVAVNDHGDAVVSWLELDLNDNARMAAARRLPSHNWDGRILLSPVNEDVLTTSEVAVDGSGRVVAAYATQDAQADRQVKATTWKAGADPTTATLSDTSALLPALAVNDAGTALVAYHDVQGDQTAIEMVRRPAGGAWSAPDQVSAPGEHGSVVDIDLADNGFGLVAFTGKFQGDNRVQSVKVQPNGDTGAASFASPTGKEASHPSLDLNGAGDAFIAWRWTGDGLTGLGQASAKPTGGWQGGNLPVPVSSPSAPSAAISDSGAVFVGYTGNGHLLAAYRTNPILLFSSWDSGNQDFVTAPAAIGIDEQGNALLAGVARAGAPTIGQVTGRFLDTAGPTTTLTTPQQAQVLADQVSVGWKGADRFSNVMSATLRQRAARWDGGFGEPSFPAQGQVGDPFVRELQPGRTYCWSVQAKDSSDNLGAWAAERCTTTPVDDAKLVTSPGFTDGFQKGNYHGTITAATTPGATLRLPGVQARRLALVVAKSPNAGEVRVTFDGKKLGTYSLVGTGKRKIVPVTTFGKVRSGKLVLEVVGAAGRPVRIDGVVAAK